ncbi:maestro heat-like repeat family member 5 isoform X2 [Notamacropus eugenii]|uniref:maestro heat-like repeat family member 5 isoform X2 n=1 Tax=Notamacropus eugenii TaxID=9315 RepID=UPI003B68086D
MAQHSRSLVSHLRSPSLQNFDATKDLEVESPCSRSDLSTRSKSVCTLSQPWPPKIFPHCQGEPKAVLTSNSKDSICSDVGCCWVFFFQKARKSQVESGLMKIGIFTEETRNAAICFNILKSLGMKKCCQVKASILKLCIMAQNHHCIVLTSIQQFLQENEEQLEPKHRFRILKVLETVITSGPLLSEYWIQTFTCLALQHMLQVTDLEEAYQNAASDLLVAVWMHSSGFVMPKLLNMFWPGEFPHRSVLYAMGKIISKESNQNMMLIGFPSWGSDKEDSNQRNILGRVMKTRNNKLNSVAPDYDTWESDLFQVGELYVHSLTEKTWKEELNHEINRYECSYPGQSSEKAFLYLYYGFVLRASDNAGVVKEHLSTLLGTSHKFAFQREGIAITIGLAATRHLSITCAVLEEFGKTIILEKTPTSEIGQYMEDMHRKWASSTVLLCYGHVASRTKDNILTLADSIASQIMRYFQCSHWKLIKKEPRDILCTSTLQDAMLAVVGLSKLKPPLGVKEKSELLYTCFQSVFTLPLVEHLEKHTCLMMNPPNVQVLYRQTVDALDQVLQGFLSENPDPGEVHYILEQMIFWMDSRLSHERQRAVRSSTTFLKFIVEQFNFTFTRIGCLVGMLGMICGDPDKSTRQQAMEGVFYLYIILLRQKGLYHMAEAKMQEKRRTQIYRSDKGCAPHTIGFLSSYSKIVKTFGEHFDISQMRDFLLTLVDGLHCSVFFRAQTAVEMLCKIFEYYGNHLNEVAEIGKKLYLQLCLIQTTSIRKTALWAISLLVQQHTQELVFTFLEFSLPMSRDTVELWRAVGSSPKICSKVLHFLLQKLEQRPSLEESIQLGKTCSESLAAMNTLYEIIFVPEYQSALKTAFPQFFFSMVTQIYYIFELNLQDENYSPVNKDFAIFPSMKTSPSCTSVETVKSLFSKNGFWKEFAFMELQDAWAQLAKPRSFCQGVCMLSRAMVEYSCPHIPGIMLHSISMLQNKEERQRIVAMIFFTEFLRSPLTSRLLPRRVILTHLHKGIKDSSLVVQTISFHCFSNIFRSPEKRSLLRAQLPALLDALYDPSERVIMASLCSMSNTLYQLGKQTVGPLCLDIALTLRSFFDDEREMIRGSAIYIFGTLVDSMQGKESPLLKDQVCWSLIPLFFHLMDQEEVVVKKAKFTLFRCTSFLKWTEPEKLFYQIAWEEGLQALHSIWKYFMENMFFKVDLFLSQALGYVHSKQRGTRIAAILFIGHTLSLLPCEMSWVLDEQAVDLLYQIFAKLKEDKDRFIRHVAASHFGSLQKVAQLV